jgi:hypothetical protein
MNLFIGISMDWRDWAMVCSLTEEEEKVLLDRAGGWVIIDMDKFKIWNFVHRKWEDMYNQKLENTIKDDLKFFKSKYG